MRSRTRPGRLMTAVPSTAEEPARGRGGGEATTLAVQDLGVGGLLLIQPYGRITLTTADENRTPSKPPTRAGGLTIGNIGSHARYSLLNGRSALQFDRRTPTPVKPRSERTRGFIPPAFRPCAGLHKTARG